MLPVEQPFKVYTDLHGQPLQNGYVYFGVPNQNPITSPVTVYWDAAGTQPAAQPIRTLNGYMTRNGTPANVFYGADYSELVQDSKRRQVFYARTSADFSIASYVTAALASVATFIQLGVGAVVRTVLSKLRENFSVQDFGVVGDGVADDTAALAAAVAAAASAGRVLNWNSAICKVSGNILNIHTVKHNGPGQVKRGADTFNISGSGTANLYVSTAGSSSNDGLTAALPKATLQQAFNAVANYGPLVTQKFNIYMAAGTYLSTTAITFQTASVQYVDVFGEYVGGHPSVPITILDGGAGAGAAYAHGIFAQGDGVRLIVSEIKGINYNTGGGSVGDRTRGVFVFDHGADGWLKNCHVTGASWFGAYGTSALRMLIEGGIYDGCRIGINTDNSRVSVGWNGSPASWRPQIKNSTEQGIAWSNGTQGHIDYTDIYDNALGVHMEGGSRCDAVDLNFKRNTIAVDLIPGGFFGDNPGAPCNFNVGTADANVTNIKSQAYGADYNNLLKNSISEARIEQYRGVFDITGTTSDMTYYTANNVPAGFFRDSTQRLRILVMGTVTTAALPATLKCTVAGVALGNMTMPANVIAGQAFRLEIDLCSNGAGNHLVSQRLIAGTATTDRFSLGQVTFNFTPGNSAIVFSGNVQNAADLVRINRLELYAGG